MQRSFVFVMITCLLTLNGCAIVFQKGSRTDVEKIVTLQSELDELRNAKKQLEDQLAQAIKDNQVKVEMAERGLVITFVAEILFNSGKDKLRTEAAPLLDKVSNVLSESVPENSVGIEGHTDNAPIKYSGWKSNWELSAARALSVLHHLEKKGIDPQRMSAIGYGEYRPVDSNDTAQGRQKNRRVEIVILPKIQKQREGAAAPAAQAPANDVQTKELK